MKPDRFKFRKISDPRMVVLILFSIGFLVRLLGLYWGLPDAAHHASFHPDEYIVLAYSQNIDIAQGQLTPGFYNYGSLYLILLSVVTKLLYFVGGYSGPIGSSPEMLADFHMAGRLISVLAGASLCSVIGSTLLRITHTLGAYAGGMIAAFAPGLVVHSRFQTVDMLAAALIVVSLLYVFKVLLEENRTIKNAALAGMFAGLSAGTKYTGGLILVSLFIACLYLVKIKGRGLAIRTALVGSACALVAFVLATPGSILDTQKFLHDFMFEMGHTSSGHGLVFVGTPNGFVYHIGNLVRSIGGFGLLLSVAGLLAALVKRWPWAVCAAGFFLLYFVLIGRAEVKFLRYVFPLIPMLAIGFGYLVGWAHTHQNPKWRCIVAFAILAIGGFGGGGLAASLTYSYWMSTADPRTEAARYMKRVSDSSTTVGLVSDPWFYTPPLFPEANHPVPATELKFEAMKRTFSPHVVRFVPLEGMGTRYDWDERLITELAPNFILYSSFESDDLERLRYLRGLSDEHRLLVKRYVRFQNLLKERYEPDRMFGSGGPTVHDMMYVRPKIWIWKKRADLQTPASGSSTSLRLSAGPASTQ